MVYLKIDIPKIEERYIIYKNGDIFDKKLRKYCKKHLNKKGYHCVWIANIGKNLYVHRLVLCKYNPIDNEIYFQVNHKNTIKTDNRLDNLEWVTQSENQKHAFENGLISRKEESNSQSKLSEEQVKSIISELLNEVPAKEIALKYNVSKGMISRIRTKRAWINLTKNIEFPISKYSNNVKSIYDGIENELLECLENGEDLDSISKKLHLSKRYIRDFKYRKLGVY